MNKGAGLLSNCLAVGVEGATKEACHPQNRSPCNLLSVMHMLMLIMLWQTTSPSRAEVGNCSCANPTHQVSSIQSVCYALHSPDSCIANSSSQSKLMRQQPVPVHAEAPVAEGHCLKDAEHSQTNIIKAGNLGSLIAIKQLQAKQQEISIATCIGKQHLSA